MLASKSRASPRWRGQTKAASCWSCGKRSFLRCTKPRRASPLRAETLAGVAPAYVITAGLDPLRDSGREYAAHLVQLGTETVYLEFPGIIHGFTTLRKAIPSGQNDLEAFLDAVKLMVERHR